MHLDDLRPIGRYIADNSAAFFALLGVLIAGVINVVLQRGLFSSKITLERNERIRELLGSYVAAIHARYAARKTLASRDASVAAVVANNPGAVLKEVVGGKRDPALAAAYLRRSEATDALRQTDSDVESLFFQLSIILRPSESDAVFAAKGLDAAENDDSEMYVNAYNLMLGVAGYYFSDGNKEHRKSAKKNIDTYRPLLEVDWNSYVAERDRDRVNPKKEQVSASPSGAGHHGTDNEPTSETQGDNNGSRDHDEPGSPSGDRQ